MPRATFPHRVETMDDLLERLGGIAPRRVLLRPTPGTATEQDLEALLERGRSLYELIDGVLVEKALGYSESSLAAELIFFLRSFLEANDLGIVAAPDGALRLMPGLVLIPDVSFVRWEKLPSRRLPTEPIPALVPNLAVEVLSPGNTRAEMKRKLRRYFLVGVETVWYVDPARRTIDHHTVPDRHQRLVETDTLDGGTVLPGFRLEVRKVFEKLPPAEPDTNRKRPR